MLGTLVKNHIVERGLKISFIAGEVGMSMPILSAVLNEKRKLSAEELFSICNALKVDANYFAELMKEQNRESERNEQKGIGA